MACTWDFSFFWASLGSTPFPTPVWWCDPSVDVSVIFLPCVPHGCCWVGAVSNGQQRELDLTSECSGWSISNEWSSPVFQSSLPVSTWIQVDAGVWMKSRAQAVSSPWTCLERKMCYPSCPCAPLLWHPMLWINSCVPLAQGLGTCPYLCLGGWESWLHLALQAPRVTQVAVI